TRPNSGSAASGGRRTGGCGSRAASANSAPPGIGIRTSDGSTFDGVISASSTGLGSDNELRAIVRGGSATGSASSPTDVGTPAGCGTARDDDGMSDNSGTDGSGPANGCVSAGAGADTDSSGGR